jgi:hypothetical protein
MSSFENTFYQKFYPYLSQEDPPVINGTQKQQFRTIKRGGGNHFFHVENTFVEIAGFFSPDAGLTRPRTRGRPAAANHGDLSFFSAVVPHPPPAFPPPPRPLPGKSLDRLQRGHGHDVKEEDVVWPGIDPSGSSPTAVVVA